MIFIIWGKLVIENIFHLQIQGVGRMGNIENQLAEFRLINSHFQKHSAMTAESWYSNVGSSQENKLS